MITGIKTIVLYCSDVERSRAWYETAGFEYSHGYGGMHWMKAGSSLVMLHPIDPPKRNNGTPALDVSVEDIDALFVRARDGGLDPHEHETPGPLAGPVTKPWGDRVFELQDPDGTAGRSCRGSHPRCQ